MKELSKEIRSCTECAAHLEHGPRPIFAAHPESRIIIIGQAPGRRVHETGVPWDDKSGENLRAWMGIDETTFYESRKVAIIPMGFCYPGKGKSGDLPPRPECAPLWHERLLNKMTNIKLRLIIGRYAQEYYLTHPYKTLTETVRNYRDFLPDTFVLPHPSPRNNIWRAKNPWFDTEVIPQLQAAVSIALG